MSQIFVIESQPGKKAIFDSPQLNEKGRVESFRFTLESPNMTVVREVYYPHYWQSFSEYLRDLAESWSGWIGFKKWRSAECELSVETTMSSTGHATMKFSVWVYGFGREKDWTATAEFDIESGQLDNIAKQVKKFLGG